MNYTKLGKGLAVVGLAVMWLLLFILGAVLNLVTWIFSVINLLLINASNRIFHALNVTQEMLKLVWWVK